MSTSRKRRKRAEPAGDMLMPLLEPKLSPAQIAERSRRIRAEEAERTKAESERHSNEILELCKRYEAEAEAADRRFRGVACADSLFSTKGTELARATRGATACLSTGAMNGCEFANHDRCAVRREWELCKEIIDRLSSSRVPPLDQQVILRSIPRRGYDGRRSEIVPLFNDPSHPRYRRSFTAVDLFLARKPAELEVDGSAVPFRGDELFLTLAGGTGSVKTIPACWAIARNGGVYVHATEMAEVSDMSKQLFARAFEARLLVLDDVGTEYSGATRYAASKIEELLIRRHSASRRTIITTNLDLRSGHRTPERSTFLERYGERLVSRMRQLGVYIAFSDPDVRLQ